MSTSWWKRVLSGAWVVVGTFLVAEVLLRVLSSNVLIYDLEMMKYAKELKVRSPLPAVVHQHRTNAKAELMGVDISLNSLGHRSADLINPKAPDIRRIHFIGSSILLGWGVAQAKGMVDRVAHLLNQKIAPKTGLRYVSINAGIGNYNTHYEVELFEQQVNKTNPDLVVLQYYINDAEPNPTGRDNPIFMKSVAAAFIYLRIKSLIAVGTRDLKDHYRALYREGQPDWERTKRAFRKLKSICSQKNIPLVVFLVPENHDFSIKNPYQDVYRKLEQALSELEIPLINPIKAMREKFGDNPSTAWVAKDDPHPSAAAHEVMAQELFHFVSRIKL